LVQNYENLQDFALQFLKNPNKKIRIPYAIKEVYLSPKEILESAVSTPAWDKYFPNSTSNFLKS